MKAVFRTDASLLIGSGHVMRCIALADALADAGWNIDFVCREFEGHLCDLLEAKGWRVHRLPSPKGDEPQITPATRHGHWLGVTLREDAEQTAAVLEKNPTVDCLVVDHYALDAAWETAMRPFVKKILAIDDLADRPHDCDLLLDQNLSRSNAAAYARLVPHSCETLLGPRYALLRPEFRRLRGTMRGRDGSVKRILVSFGVSDQTNETGKTLEAIRSLPGHLTCDVVVGRNNPWKEKIRALCADLPDAAFHLQVDYMAKLIADADLAVGAGGSTTWERSCLGLPSLLVSVAFNQEAVSRESEASGIGLYLGPSERVTSMKIAEEIEKLRRDPERVRLLSETAASLVDGEGTGRIRERLEWRQAP